MNLLHTTFNVSSSTPEPELFLLAFFAGKGLWFVAFILGIYLLCFWVPRRMKIVRARRDAMDKRQRDEARHMKEATNGLMVEMNTMGRDLISQIDSKISVLKELLRQVDSTATHVEGLLEQADKASQPHLEKEESDSAEAVQNISQAQEITESINKQVSELHQQIYALADEGKQAKEIAEELSERHGEVELILGLRKRESEDS